MITTYFINGFLDSGKSTFINGLFKLELFDKVDRGLLIQCEEGEQEYDYELLESRNISVVSIEDEEDFNPEFITNIEKNIKPKVVIVEFNGMWMRKNIEFPWYWNKPIEITLFNAKTFDMYSRNMKSLVAEQVRNCQLVIFNRCDDLMDKLPAYRRNVKAIGTGIDVIFEDKNGEIRARFDEDLPYDISKDEIEITEDSFATFYLDSMENVDRYVGKKVTVNGMVQKRSPNSDNTLIVGRYVMTCCAEDISVFGFICDFEDATDLELDEWISITADVEKDYAEKYKLWYPVLKVNSYKRIETPENEVIENI